MVNLLLTASMGQTRFVTKKRFQNDCQVFINAKFRPKVSFILVQGVEIAFKNCKCGNMYSLVPNTSKS